MSSFRKILDLGDPQITATFQRWCGIRIHSDPHGSKYNGVCVNGTANHQSAGNGSGRSSKQNGTKFEHLENKTSSNGCSTILSNGHGPHSKNSNGFIHHNCNGHIPSHDHATENSLKQRHQPTKNGYKKAENGQVPMSYDANHSISENYMKNGKDANSVGNGHVPNGIAVKHDNPPEYTIDNYFLYYIFSFGASLGNEVFYILFFSFALWNFDCFVVRKTCIVWAIAMYFGQAAKDIIRWPRPTSPPVARLEKRYELEYGMPSTHAMVGVAIPFGMIVYMYGRYEMNLVYSLLFAVTWSILVSFSRLYLGMHSALDIFAGLVFAFVLMGLTIPVVDPLDSFLVSHEWGLPVMVAVCIFLCLLYPKLDKWSTARGDTTLCLAVFSGIYAGLWLTHQLMDFEPPQENPPYVLALPSASCILMTLARQVIGVIGLVGLLSSFKVVFLHAVCRLLGFNPKDPKSKENLLVELPYKYVCYFLPSTAATYLMPVIFSWLNIARIGYYSEIRNHT